MFKQCTSLTQVKVDAKIITLPKNTFMDCFALHGVDFTGADKVKRMRESCFENCIHLRTIVLLTNLGFIEDCSFKACIGLEHITIHKNVRSIGNFGFFGCTNLCSVILHDGLNSLTPKSIPAGTKLVLFGRYVLNIYVGIVRYFLCTTKTQRAKIYLLTQRTNRRISYDIN